MVVGVVEVGWELDSVVVVVEDPGVLGSLVFLGVDAVEEALVAEGLACGADHAGFVGVRVLQSFDNLDELGCFVVFGGGVVGHFEDVVEVDFREDAGAGEGVWYFLGVFCRPHEENSLAPLVEFRMFRCVEEVGIRLFLVAARV